MPKERSIDIDDELDLIIAETIARRAEASGDAGSVADIGNPERLAGRPA
jgi:hypothetical protein